MPQRDALHESVEQALVKDGWRITDDPYVISIDQLPLKLVVIDVEKVEVEQWIPPRHNDKS